MPPLNATEPLAAAVRAAGEAEIAALALDEGGRTPGKVLQLAREHGVVDQRAPDLRPVEAAAVNGDGAAA